MDIAKTVSPDISQDILSGKLHPTDRDVNDIIKATPEQRAETIAQLVKPKEKRPINRRNKDLALIDQIYEELKAPKRVTEDSGLESLHSVTRNMMETCDVLFEHFPGMLAKLEYGEQVAEIMREAKNYTQKILDKIAKKTFSEKMKPMLQKSYEEMLAPKPKVDENSILRSLECAVEDFLRLHHRMEDLFPGLRSNSEYRARLIKPIEQIEDYLNELRAVE